MLAKSYILSNLNSLDRMYRGTSSSKAALFYSKLALLELCGWIEESMDDVVIRCSIRHLRQEANRNYIKNDVVKKNYGFEYNRHFRKMLIHLIGIVQVEKLEGRIDTSVKANFESTLGALKTARNSEAHTHIKGVTRVINAPSVTISQFTAVWNGLQAYDSELRAKRF